MNRLDLHLHDGALRLGLPDAAAKSLVRWRRAARHPVLVLRRQSIPERLRRHPWFSLISRDQGHALFSADDLDRVAPAIEACRAIREEVRERDTSDHKKPFFANVMSEEALNAYPAIMDLVLSDAVLAAVTGYFGEVPRLKGVGLYLSPANETTRSSQLFHFDHDDRRQIKCFVNVEAVDEDNGPFTFLAKPESARIRDRVKAEKGRYSDDDITREAPVESWLTLQGPAGSAGFVDTSNCLHFGSRARRGDRLALMFQFTRFPDYRLDKGKLEDGQPLHRFPLERYARDDLTRLVLQPVRAF